MKYFLFLMFWVMAIPLFSQQAALARRYFSDGEFEKAAILYKELHLKNTANDYYFERYFVTLLELEDYKTAEQMIKKSLKQHGQKIERYVNWGVVNRLQGSTDKAISQFEKSIKLMVPDQVGITRLATAFVKNKEYEYAIEVYQKGEKLMKVKHIFSYEMGSVYRQKGDVPNMISSYLDCLSYLPSRLTNIQAFFQRELSAGDGFNELMKQLMQRLAKTPENTVYAELVIWIYTQQKDFENALVHARALDLRLGENGSRIFRLARTAFNEKDYDATIASYSYLIDEKGTACPYYVDAKEGLLRAKRDKITITYTPDKGQLEDLRDEYYSFLKEFGKGASTVGIIIELAELEAIHLHDLSKSIALLEGVLQMHRVPRNVVNQTKLNLGDYYLMKNEEWEATLLYSQVDKEMKDAPMGELARFKNAKLSYYRGDFEWSQDQLDVLKGATSELVSNDAIDLGVFIMDHYALDTTANTMKLYAKADLYLFQNQFEASVVLMDSILTNYKGHGLTDDILFQKAEIQLKKGYTQQAIDLLNELLKDHEESILLDNTIFKLGTIYEEQLGDTKEAMRLYESILFDHPGSLFINEARKRFRKLRGDGV